MRKGVVLMAVIMLFVCGAVYAQEGKKRTPRAKKKQQNQEQRIKQGVRSGELTKEEAQELREGEKEIRGMKKDARSDGTVTKKERQELHKALNEQSKDIDQEKHDGNKGEPRPGNYKKRTPGAAGRQMHQKSRINQGIKSGELTKDEAKDLREGEKEIRDMKKDARSDGTVTQEERKELNRELNEQSKEIYEEKHDGDKK